MDWRKKLTSRKFWTAVASFVTLMITAFGVAEDTAAQVSAIIMAGASVVAYIIGEWEFYGLSLDISREVLIPRVDTEVLAEQAVLAARSAGEGCRVLDLCTGSGCVGLAVAANVPDCKVVLADISEGALRICRQNIRRCGFNNRVIFPRLTF